MPVADVISVFFGCVIVAAILFDIFASVIVPRPIRSIVMVSALLRRYTWRIWRFAFIGVQPAQRREVLLGIFAPFNMVLLFCGWVFGLILGFGLIFFGLRSGIHPPAQDLGTAVYYAGTSLLTIGYGDFVADSGVTRFFSIAAAASGLATIAVVLTFLFSLFASFQRREVFVVTLDARGSSPASGLALLETHATLDLVHDLPRLFQEAQTWCAEVLDTHLAYPVLCYFRSSHVDVSWISALGALLDAATLAIAATEDIPKGQAFLMHSVGAHLTFDLAKYFGLLAEPNVLVERSEFQAARERLRSVGYALAGEEQSWETFCRLRSEYAGTLNNMARYWAITPAQWIGDRSPLSSSRHEA
ncbi:MAG: two pore domain potassium channel family protein [Candidatus Eremiobacteraeota bacterium]|nr:two pore domain potassium channel family protein [Candidatus Eremiobacteraeota bacterium]